MARVDVVMPQMGESIAEGTLSKWLKKVGDQVKRDEPIFEISTDKVDAEIPAPSSGVLAEILVTEGQTVPVQTVVARLETDVNAAIGASAPAPVAAGSGAGGGASRSTSSPAAGGPPRKESAPAPPGSHQSVPTQPTPRTKTAATRSRIASAPSRRRSSAAWPPSTASRSRGLQGSGIAGRVTKKDLVRFLESGASAPTRPPAVGRAERRITGRCPNRGRATASSRCRRCARSSPSTW